MKLVFTPKAAKDLSTIAAYSLREWGEDQARNYLQGLELACGDLVRNFGLGREIDGFRRRRYERHLIYYLCKDEAILVVRILHERMLPSRHL